MLRILGVLSKERKGEMREIVEKMEQLRKGDNKSRTVETREYQWRLEKYDQ